MISNKFLEWFWSEESIVISLEITFFSIWNFLILFESIFKRLQKTRVDISNTI